MVLSFNKWLLLLAIPVVFNATAKTTNFFKEKQVTVDYLHPFHVSVTEINHNASDKTLEISCKLFTDDFEAALSKKYQAKIDLIHPTDKTAMDKFISNYIHDNLQIKIDGKTVSPNYLGYEVENEAVYAYLQVDKIAIVKKVDVVNSLMYDLFTDQVGINHIVVGGSRKSVKLDYPEKVAGVVF